MTIQPGYQPNTGVSPYPPGNPAYAPPAEVTRSEHIFYKRLLEYEIDEIKPVITESGVEYPALDPFKRIYRLSDVFKLLDSLASKHWIQRCESETVLGCPECGSLQAHAKGNCVKCSSGNVHSEVILEHRLCGFKGYKRHFRKGVDEVCPKCGKLVDDETVQVLGSLFVCEQCTARFNEPKIGFTCEKCGNEYSSGGAKYRILKSYSISTTQESLPKPRPAPRKRRIWPDPFDEPDEVEEKEEIISPRPKPEKKGPKLSLPFDLDEQEDYDVEDTLYPVMDEPLESVEQQEPETVNVEEPEIIEPTKVGPELEEEPEEEIIEDQPAQRRLRQQNHEKTIRIKPKSSPKKLRLNVKKGSYRVMVLSDDHPMVEGLYNAFQINSRNNDFKIVHHMDSRQLLRSLRRKSDLIVIDNDTTDVNTSDIVEEIVKWGVNTPIILLSSQVKKDAKTHLSKKSIKKILPKNSNGYKKTSVFLL